VFPSSPVTVVSVVTVAPVVNPYFLNWGLTTRTTVTTVTHPPGAPSPVNDLAPKCGQPLSR
jgi:hypothetical protein